MPEFPSFSVTFTHASCFMPFQPLYFFFILYFDYASLSADVLPLFAFAERSFQFCLLFFLSLSSRCRRRRRPTRSSPPMPLILKWRWRDAAHFATRAAAFVIIIFRFRHLRRFAIPRFSR